MCLMVKTVPLESKTVSGTTEETSVQWCVPLSLIKAATCWDSDSAGAMQHPAELVDISAWLTCQGCWVDSL